MTRTGLAFGLFLAASIVAPSARAAEEEVLLNAAVDAGGGLGEAHALGIGGELGVWFGLDPFLWLELAAGGTSVDGAPGSARLWAGGVWALDVLQWVPWAEGGLGMALDAEGRWSPAGRVSLGVDHLLDFTWSVGVFGRLELVPRRLGGPRGVGGLRLGYRFEP